MGSLGGFGSGGSVGRGSVSEGSVTVGSVTSGGELVGIVSWGRVAGGSVSVGAVVSDGASVTVLPMPEIPACGMEAEAHPLMKRSNRTIADTRRKNTCLCINRPPRDFVPLYDDFFQNATKL